MRLAGDALRDQEVAGRGGAAGAERQIVFARAALVGMAFDGDGVVAVLVEPLRLLATASPARRRGSTEESVSKKMRSPTLTVKSCAEPGVAGAEAEIGCVFGVFLEAQPAIASDGNERDDERIRGECCGCGACPASP